MQILQLFYRLKNFLFLRKINKLLKRKQ